MSEVRFEILVQMPVGLSPQLQRDLHVAIKPRWQVGRLEMKKEGKGVFRLILGIDEADLPRSSLSISKIELRQFRDLMVSLLSFCAMAPIQLASKGIFDFPRGGGEHE
jgi:hypothetical protein